ncbi:hypothetical protein [Pseudonocardia sp.]|uniref:hypothetical protein n=1 Tax=Pseudonocardia sp. TaxID=60912 RepID=UPI003D0F897A
MSLANVWVQALDGSLVRADQVTEMTLHQTPEIAGKPSRWLFDVATGTPVGSGDADGWRTGPLHRTLAQADAPPRGAPVALARLLAQLDAVDAAGVVRADVARRHGGPDRAAAGDVHFGFTPFTTAAAHDAPTRQVAPSRDGTAPATSAAGGPPPADRAPLAAGRGRDD